MFFSKVAGRRMQSFQSTALQTLPGLFSCPGSKSNRGLWRGLQTAFRGGSRFLYLKFTFPVRIRLETSRFFAEAPGIEPGPRVLEHSPMLPLPPSPNLLRIFPQNKTMPTNPALQTINHLHILAHPQCRADQRPVTVRRPAHQIHQRLRRMTPPATFAAIRRIHPCTTLRRTVLRRYKLRQLFKITINHALNFSSGCSSPGSN